VSSAPGYRRAPITRLASIVFPRCQEHRFREHRFDRFYRSSTTPILCGCGRRSAPV
jgi:hypothetical protein